MILTDVSIKRPVFATVISLLIITFGIAALLELPVREYPDIDPAEVAISTDYIGAAPEVIDTQITQVIEAAISRVDGIKSIQSSSEQNDSRTTVEFVTGRDVDVAANDIRDAISQVADRLPEEAEAPVVSKSNADARPMIWLSLQSDIFNSQQLTDFAERTLVDRLSVLSGVADVRIGGERRYAIRVWLDRQRLAALELSVAEVERALRANNIELPAGEIESSNRKFTVRTDSRLSGVEQFRDLVIGRQGNYQIRLDEVAEVSLDVEDDSTYLRANGRTAIGLGIIRQSKSNTVAISDRVREEIENIRPQLPPEIDLQVSYDESLFIRASIKEVLITLGISILLVILVIFVFLRSFRATLIPAFTIPVAIVGAFSGLAFLGFSINVLTLLAVILAIGLVVDDAIVMLENIQRRIDSGEPRLVAAYRGAKQVSFAIVATTVTLVAVFVPVSFMGGNVGRLFAEFGFTLAIAVIFSSIVALTLAPMLCSKWLSPSPTSDLAHHRLYGATERFFNALTRGYRRLLGGTLNRPVLTLTVGFAGIILAAGVFPRLAHELAPTEDRGVFIIPATAPVGSTSEFTNHHVNKLEERLLPFLENGEVSRILSITGFRGESNRAFMIVGLTPWDERRRTQQDVVAEVNPLLREVPGLKSFAVNPPGLGQSSFRQPFQVVVGGPDYEQVKVWSQRLMDRAKENPNLRNVEIDYEERQPEISVRIDREKAADLGITMQDIGLTLQTMLASRQVARYLDRGREYDVIMQARDTDRATPQDLESIFLRPREGGQLIPLGAVASTEEIGVPRELRRVDRLPAVTLSASLAPGYDLGTALDYINKLAAEELPTEARISLQGLSREFSEASSAVYITFGLAFLIVFLVLAAQFESWVHPAIIMLSVPLAITGALMALWLTGISLNIYSQIGMVMLLGLMAKNGILVVEFANQLRDQGYNVRDAILEGSAIRFRPILMTTISTIFGAIPLVIATGAGAESRASIGVVILGGLLFATILTLFIVPVLYNLLARFTRSANAVAKDLDIELERFEDPEKRPQTRIAGA